MSVKEENVLVLFSRNESKIEKLYKLYSAKFPQYKKLWQELAREENIHAEILKDLSRKFKENHKFFKMNEYSIPIINYVSNFIDEQLKRLKSGKVILKEALEAALQIERSMIEKKSIEMFEPTHGDILGVFKRLNHETDRHVKMLIKALNKNISGNQ